MWLWTTATCSKNNGRGGGARRSGCLLEALSVFYTYRGYVIREGDCSCSISKDGVFITRAVSVEAATKIIDRLITEELRSPRDDDETEEQN